jgi:hypothetical protein
MELLRKLNQFHFPIFSQPRNEGLDAILEAYKLK